MMKRLKRRTPTSPGLGDSGMHAIQPMGIAPVPTISGLHNQEPGAHRDRSDRSEERSETPEATPPLSAEKVSTRRARTRSSRPPIRIDDVGEAAVAIASSRAPLLFDQARVPKLLKTRRELTDAPIDHRDAFVVSLIDGKMTLQVLIDVSGMPEPEITRILQRLQRLGIVSLA